MGFQEIQIVDVVQSITKYAVTVTEPDTIRYHLEKAVHLARSGRPGPVWLDIPLDVQSADIDETRLRGFDTAGEHAPVRPETLRRQVTETIERINASERPVLLAGNGIRLAGGEREFKRLIELLRIPVLTTWKAIDFLPESHPLYAGRPGAVGQRGANFAQQNADCLLMIGARMDFGQTGYNHANLARAAVKIMVDIDPKEIGKMATRIDVPVCADARAFLRELLARANELATRNRSGWLARCKDWQARYPVIRPEHWTDDGYVNLYALIDVLSEQMTGEDLLIPGSSGACSEATMQAFRVQEGMRIFNSEGLGPMGFGIAASIGGCVASGGRRTVCVEGDGGFHMNSQELEVVRRLNLPVKFFVLNNQGYGSIRATQQNYFNGRFVASDASSGLTLPDICKIGRSYGIPSTSIKTNQELRKKVRSVLRSRGPAVCEVRISPDQVTAPKLYSMQRADGSIVSKPLEDLWPFLDRREFLSNMLIPPLDEST